MRKCLKLGLLLAAAAAATLLPAAAAPAAVYPDNVGEEFSGNSNLDISSVEVTNDASNISFKINLVGDIVATNWGKYMVGVDTNPGTGDPAGNGWARPISFSSYGGMDYWLGSWADNGGGLEDRHFTGGAWTLEHASYDATNPLAGPALAQHSTTLTVPLSYLGLADGSVIHFDVYSGGGGGGDSANDASSNPNQSTDNWGTPYNSGNLVSTYTVVVPEPAAAVALLAPAAALVLRRRGK